MTWRTLAEALESAIAKGFDGEQGVGAPQAVTEFMAEDRSGLDATPVTPPRTGTVPAHGNVKGKGSRPKPGAVEQGGVKQREKPLCEIQRTGILPVGREIAVATPNPRRASPTQATTISLFTVIEGSGRRAPEGGTELAGRTRNAGRERVREYLRLAWSA